MTDFICVHGAWHGGWCWSRLASVLRAEGHQVFTPTLTGLGERSHLFKDDIDLNTHIDDIVNVMRWEDLKDFVLVVHSYGGMIARHVADRYPDRVRQVFYVDAFVPEDGRSLESYLPDKGASGRARAERNGWQLPPFSAAILNVNEADRPWVDSKCTPHPYRTFETPASLGGTADAVPATYILAEDNPNRHFAQFAAQAKSRGWPCHGLRGGHDLMIDNPLGLATLMF